MAWSMWRSLLKRSLIFPLGIKLPSAGKKILIKRVFIFRAVMGSSIKISYVTPSTSFSCIFLYSAILSSSQRVQRLGGSANRIVHVCHCDNPLTGLRFAFPVGVGLLLHPSRRGLSAAGRAGLGVEVN